MKGLRKIFAAFMAATVLAAFPVSIPLINTTTYAEAAAVALNKTKITVYVSDTYTLKLNGSAQSAKWSSDNPRVATVSSKGVVTGVRKGSAVITAQAGAKKYNCTVTVKSYSISDKSLKLEINSEETLSILGASGKVAWSSSNPSVASVDSNGTVSAKAAGTAKITGIYKSTSYSCYVTVLGGKLHASSTKLTISKETSVTITVDDLQEDENIDYDIDKDGIVSCELGEWTGSQIPLTITPLAAGTAKITLTTNYKDEKLDISVTVTDSAENTTGELQTDALSAVEVYDKCSPSTVQINTDIAIGSGFFIDKNRVVTNYHVIDGAKSINIQLQNGNKIDVDYIIGYDKNLDIAILSVPTEAKPLQLNQHGLKIGEKVYTIGSSLGLTDTFTDGIITNKSRVIDNVDYIQTNAAITNGNSGGPLLNAYGEVIGINTWQYVNGQNLNFAINIEQLSKVDTSKPVKASDFYNNITADTKVIYEDETKSGSVTTCQDIPSGITVVGSSGPSTDDYYKFTLSSKSEVALVALTSSGLLSELRNLSIQITDQNNTAAATASLQIVDGTTYLVIDKVLSAGTYYVKVRNTKGASDILYGLVLLY